MHSVHYSSASREWRTPRALFAVLDREFRFDLDAAATAENALCPRFYGEAEDGLLSRWAGSVFCNPPYGYGIWRWVEKAFRSSQEGATVVLLIPARTDTRWWHEWVMRAAEVRLVRGRLYFGTGDGLAAVNAPFPNAVVVFRPGEHQPRFTAMDRVLDPGHVKDHRTAAEKAVAS